jgi:hypothetical protein
MTTRTLSLHPAIAATTSLTLTLDFGRSFEQQIRDFFEKAPDLRGYASYGLPGQSVGAVLTLPVLEMACGFPVTPIYDIGKKEVVGNLDLGNFRHHTVRPRRSELPRGEAYSGYTVIDGAGRGLTALQKSELEEVLGTTDIRVVSAPTGHIDFTDPTKGIVDTLLATGLTFEDWTSGRVIYLPAGMGLSAVVQATAIYGLSEIWPRTIRLNRRDDQQFHIDELVDPQALRQFGVNLQAKWQDTQPVVTLSGNVPEDFRRLLAELAEAHCVTVRN